jgi:type IV pilus assembly protein PilV
MEVANCIRSRSQAGVTLVEVLVTMVILAIGLLGLVALQARVQVLQAEAYQRAQALMLLKDMAGRIASNRNNAALYAAGTMPSEGVGAHMGPCDPPDAGTPRHEADIAEWCIALQGAAETLGPDDARVGAMVGGRGCVQDLDNGRFMVTVAWQGLAPISAPPASVTCGLVDGASAYDGGEGSTCTDDLCRRVVTTIVRIPRLT